MMFGPEDAKTLVECAAHALEAEDRYLLECATTRRWRDRDRPAGICDNINERYYQFVIWRALMRSFPWRPRTEDQRYDLAFYDDEANQLVAVAEIKGWWSSSGRGEIAGIRRDMEHKLGILKIPAVMLILTSQRKADADGNLQWLATQLGVPAASMISRSFDTRPWPGDNKPTEFAVIGHVISCNTEPASA
jgi:hypothetical protein